MIAWRFASTADIEQYYGERPRESLRAVAIVVDGEPAAIIGMAIERGRMRAFSEYKPALEPHLKSMPVLRAIKAAQQMFAQTSMPIVAVREGGSVILERIGFDHVDGDTYLWHGSRQQRPI